VIAPEDLIRVLKRTGFIELHVDENRVELKKANLLVTIPLHDLKFNVETLKSILRQARLDAEELVNFL